MSRFSSDAIKFLLVVAAIAALVYLGVSYQRKSGEGKSGSTKESSSIATRYPAPEGLSTHPLVWRAWAKLTLDQEGLEKLLDEALAKEGKDQELNEKIKQLNRSINRQPNPDYTKYFDQALKEDPQNPFNHMSYAFYLFPRDRERAEEEFERALEIEERPEFYAVWAILLANPPMAGGQYFVSNLSAEATARQLKRSAEYMQRAMELDPKNGYFKWAYAYALIDYGEKVEGAEKPSREEILRLVKEGNQAPHLYFPLPPPLPYPLESWQRVWAPWEKLGDLARPEGMMGIWTDRQITKLGQELIAYFKESGDFEVLYQLNDFLLKAPAVRPPDRTFLELHSQLGEEIGRVLREKYPDEISENDAAFVTATYGYAREKIWGQLITMGYRPSRKPELFDVGRWEKNWQRDNRLFDLFYPYQRQLHGEIEKLINKAKRRLEKKGKLSK